MNINELFLFVAGLVLLSGGAELVVRGALRLAASLGIEPLMLGLTVVAIGTSVPELVVGITASWQGSGALAVGNIAGTNIVNILLILGLSALLRPLPLQLQVLKLYLPVMIIAAIMMTAMAWDGLLSQLDGGLLFGAAILYTIVLIRVGRDETQAVKAEFRDMYSDDMKTGRAVARTRVGYMVLLAAGMGLTVLGGERQLLFVDIPLMVGVALLCIPVFVTGKSVSRWEGGAFIAFYLIYLLSLIFSRS